MHCQNWQLSYALLQVTTLHVPMPFTTFVCYIEANLNMPHKGTKVGALDLLDGYPVS